MVLTQTTLDYTLRFPSHLIQSIPEFFSRRVSQVYHGVKTYHAPNSFFSVEIDEVELEVVIGVVIVDAKVEEEEEDVDGL